MRPVDIQATKLLVAARLDVLRTGRPRAGRRGPRSN